MTNNQRSYDEYMESYNADRQKLALSDDTKTGSSNVVITMHQLKNLIAEAVNEAARRTVDALKGDDAVPMRGALRAQTGGADAQRYDCDNEVVEELLPAIAEPVIDRLSILVLALVTLAMAICLLWWELADSSVYEHSDADLAISN
jgi:hypothetical protein